MKYTHISACRRLEKNLPQCKSCERDTTNIAATEVVKLYFTPEVKNGNCKHYKARM